MTSHKTKLFPVFNVFRVRTSSHFARSNRFSQIPAILLKNKARQSKMKTRFSYDGMLYSFSHNKTKPLRMFPEKVDQPKKIYEKQNPKLCKTLYQSIKINVWCIQISRGKRRITYKSEFCFIFKSKLCKKS